jgi:hypothetical protein
VPPFRRVELRHAGPTALGILVPQGARTLVIVRPRGLKCDLLPARWDGCATSPPAFCTFDRDEAAGVARRLQQALGESVDAGVNPVQTLGDARGDSFQVWLRTAEFVWIVCHRAPCQAYRPALFANHEEARQLAEQLTPICWPALDAGQEYYFNTQHFA